MTSGPLRLNELLQLGGANGAMGEACRRLARMKTACKPWTELWEKRSAWKMMPNDAFAIDFAPQ